MYLEIILLWSYEITKIKTEIALIYKNYLTMRLGNNRIIICISLSVEKFNTDYQRQITKTHIVWFLGDGIFSIVAIPFIR
jgi:hypothetical protein